VTWVNDCLLLEEPLVCCGGVGSGIVFVESSGDGMATVEDA